MGFGLEIVKREDAGLPPLRPATIERAKVGLRKFSGVEARLLPDDQFVALAIAESGVES
jgi:hypothetical protein